MLNDVCGYKNNENMFLYHLTKSYYTKMRLTELTSKQPIIENLKISISTFNKWVTSKLVAYRF